MIRPNKKVNLSTMKLNFGKIKARTKFSLTIFLSTTLWRILITLVIQYYALNSCGKMVLIKGFKKIMKYFTKLNNRFVTPFFLPVFLPIPCPPLVFSAPRSRLSSVQKIGYFFPRFLQRQVARALGGVSDQP